MEERKKPKKDGVVLICPECGHGVGWEWGATIHIWEFDYCEECGCKLDWRKTNNGLYRTVS